MYSLITFATQWGSQFGGINSFNIDFLSAFGIAYHRNAQVICVVASATEGERETARNAHVLLVPLPYPPHDKLFKAEHAQAGIDELARLRIDYDADETVWLGHDRITGAAAIAAVKISGGRSALIHHMSYDHYESFAEDSVTAKNKIEEQRILFQQADLVLAVGPMLRDALCDLLNNQSEMIHMLIPGLPEIAPRSAPKTFTAFLSGRFSDNSARIKQGHLGIAAFAQAQREAIENDMPDYLCRSPKLVLRGVDFEEQLAFSSSQPQTNPETELKKFAEAYADRVINLHALPYTRDRGELFADLSSASVALMPSWHEGFGLVGWEAIAAGVPLIVSKSSGVFRLLEEEYPGNGTGCVYPIDVHGTVDVPFFSEDDLQAVVKEIKSIANNPSEARKKAGKLRDALSNHTWSACAEDAAEAFGWIMERGSIPQIPSEGVEAVSTDNIPTFVSESSEHASPLQIPIKRWKTGLGMADSQLLRAEEVLVPFDAARQPELDNLNVWLDDEKWLQAVRLITGAGGAGKTRLALELCQELIETGWHAGFLDTSLVDKEMTVSWKQLRNMNKPVLVVIDYAETRQTTLLALIKAMINDPGNHATRLLLLARDGGEWWDNLPGKDTHCEAFLSGYATSGPFGLPALYLRTEDRQEAYRLAVQAFAEALGVVDPHIDPHVTPELDREHFERPLYIQMAALLALHGERSITAEGLTKALLNHERRYWHRLLARFGWNEPERLAQQLLALTTLTGGFATPKTALSYWRAAGGDHIEATDFSALFHALSTLYPGKQGLQPLRPDLLGEALLAQTLLRYEGLLLLDTVLAGSVDRVIRHNALTVLSRLSGQRPDLHEILMESLVCHFAHCYQDIIDVAKETPGCLPELAEAAFASLHPSDKSQVSGLLAPLLLEESVQLASLSCLVMEYLAEKYQLKLAKKPGNVDLITEWAEALSNYSVALHWVGQNNDALFRALEALNLFERLHSKDKKRFDPDYAMSLNNYANHLSEAGRYEEALECARQALDINKRLAQKNPDRFDPDYAMSLNNYANHLREAGRNEEALECARQGLDINKRLAQKNPDRFDPDYAMSLNNYANRLSNAGRYEEALECARQALDIRKRLAQTNPDRFDPDYAMSLNNYANHLSNAGRYEEALECARQALDIHKRLVQKNPDRFDPDYAMSLNNYANHLSEAGRYEEALECARQALDIHKRLAQKNPDRFDPDYAMSLNNYANHLSEAGRYEEALECARQALDIHKRLAQKNPDRFDPDYAMSLNNYANRLREAGRYEEALECARQALDIRKRLAQTNPDRFDPDYATSLNNYANHLSEAGRYEEALECARQALDIRKRLAQTNPDRFDPDYAMSLNNYANHLREAGRNEEALECARQGLDINKRLAQKNPDRFDPDYAMSLNNYANRLSNAGRYEEALECARQALDIRKRLAQTNPDRFDPDYAMSLNNYANHLSNAGRYEEALECARQALDINKRLAGRLKTCFSEALYNATCSEHFLCWLNNRQPGGEEDLSHLTPILAMVQQHKHPLLLLYSAFVKACWFKDQTSRNEVFHEVLYLWDSLVLADKISAQPYWLCAAVWSTVFAPHEGAPQDWQATWQQYKKQRLNRVPHWMLEVSKQMEFQWPD